MRPIGLLTVLLVTGLLFATGCVRDDVAAPVTAPATANGLEPSVLADLVVRDMLALAG